MRRSRAFRPASWRSAVPCPKNARQSAAGRRACHWLRGPRPSESGQDTLPGAGAVARVLDDLQIAAFPGGFDAEEHAAPLDGTARLERLSASRKLIFLLHAPLRGTANQRKYRPTPHQVIETTRFTSRCSAANCPT